MGIRRMLQKRQKMYTDVTIVKLSPEDTEHVDIKPTIRPSIIVPPLTS